MSTETNKNNIEAALLVKDNEAQRSLNDLKISMYSHQKNICDPADVEDLTKLVNLLATQNEILRRIAGRPVTLSVE